jgi:hypothetical protein
MMGDRIVMQDSLFYEFRLEEQFLLIIIFDSSIALSIFRI